MVTFKYHRHSHQNSSFCNKGKTLMSKSNLNVKYYLINIALCMMINIILLSTIDIIINIALFVTMKNTFKMSKCHLQDIVKAPAL